MCEETHLLAACSLERGRCGARGCLCSARAEQALSELHARTRYRICLAVRTMKLYSCSRKPDPCPRDAVGLIQTCG